MTRPRSILDLHADMIALDELLTEAGGDISGEETTAFIDAQLAEISTNTEAVADRFCGLIRDKRLRSAALKEESDRLSTLARTEANGADAVQARLKWFWETHNLGKVKTDRFTVNIAKNGGLAPLLLPEDVTALPADYIDWRPVARTAEIRLALAAGTDVPGASLGERGTSLRIK